MAGRLAAPFWTYEDLALFIAALLPCSFLGLLIVRLSGVKGAAEVALLFQSLIYAMLLGVLYLLVSWRYQRPFWRSLSWSRPMHGARICALVSPFLAIGTSALGVGLHTPEGPDPITGMISNRISLAVVMLFVVVIGPVFEELVFRGFLLPLLVKSFGPAAGIILTALPFALLHAPQNQWIWQKVLLIGLAGVAFGYAKYKTGSTASATILHCGFNLTGALGYVIQQWASGAL